MSTLNIRRISFCLFTSRYCYNIDNPALTEHQGFFICTSEQKDIVPGFSNCSITNHTQLILEGLKLTVIETKAVLTGTYIYNYLSVFSIIYFRSNNGEKSETGFNTERTGSR